MSYYLIPCENCGLIDSTYKMVGYKHQTCPTKFYTIDRQKIAVCFEQILLTPIPSSQKTKMQCDNFVYAVNFINEYPDVNAIATIRLIKSLNAMLRET